MTEKIAAALDAAKDVSDYYEGANDDPAVIYAGGLLGRVLKVRATLPDAREELAALEEEVLRLRLENKKWEAHVATLDAPKDLLKRAEEAERAREKELAIVRAELDIAVVALEHLADRSRPISTDVAYVMQAYVMQMEAAAALAAITRLRFDVLSTQGET